MLPVLDESQKAGAPIALRARSIYMKIVNRKSQVPFPSTEDFPLKVHNTLHTVKKRHKGQSHVWNVDNLLHA